MLLSWKPEVRTASAARSADGFHAEAPRSWIRPHYASFNGLRAVAILAVFINHYGSLVRSGVWVNAFWPGVDLFFVLSGFLITGILYDAKDGAAYFRGFYIRRALRVFPLYYGFFLLLVALSGVLRLHFPRTFWTNLLYISNFIPRSVPYLNPTVVEVGRHPGWSLTFGHLWTLCVEEQFYLVWPLAIRLLPTRRSMMGLAATAAAATLALRIGLYLHNPAEVVRTAYIYVMTYTRCDGLFIGAWMALWLRGATLTRQRLRWLARGVTIPSIAILIVGALTVGRRWEFNSVNPLLCTYGYTLIDLAASGVLLLSLDDAGLLPRLLQTRCLNELGKISYGFYLFHEIPYVLVRDWRYRDGAAPLSGWIFLLGMFTVTSLLAWLSFHFFESPFLKLKDRLAPSRRRTHASLS